MIDAAMAGVDQTPPTLPKPIVEQISSHDGTGCMTSDSCVDFTYAHITNLATDDTTPAQRIGYRFSFVAGQLPSGLTLPVGVVDFAFPDASMQLTWSGVTADVDFTLQLVAVDAAGNESAPQTVRIRQDSGGCSVGPRRGSGGLVFAIAAVVLAAGTIRRRQRRA